jgi:hypothetical protein
MKKLRNLPLSCHLLISGAWLAIACVEAHAAGGVSGGGGNVIVSYPQSVAPSVPAVRSRIRALKPMMERYFQEKEAAFASGSLPTAQYAALQPLFSGYPDVAMAIRPIEVQIEEHAPCHDADGNPFDGSTRGLNSDQVCLSALRIAGKVEASELGAQISALMAHEFAEVLGLDDENAIRIQEIVLKDFRPAPLAPEL